MRTFILALFVGVLVYVFPSPGMCQGGDLDQILNLTKSILSELQTGSPGATEALPGSHTDRRLKQGAYWIPTGNSWHGILPSDIAGHWNRVKEAKGKSVCFVPCVAYNRWRTDKLNERVRLRRLGFRIPVSQPGDLVMTVEDVQHSRVYWERRSGIPSDLMPHPLLIENEKNYPWGGEVSKGPKCPKLSWPRQKNVTMLTR